MQHLECLVSLKKVIDYQVQIRVKPDNSGIVTDNVKMSLNPFDEIALEEAVLLKESGVIKKITIVTIGDSNHQDVLRAGLARGADEAWLIKIEDNLNLLPLDVAKILAAIVRTYSFNLVFLGKQSIDGDNNQTGQMLAGILDWSQGTFLSKCKFDLDKNICNIEREIDGGIEILELKLPSILTADLRLNVPRYLSLPKIMQAKSKQIKIINLSDLIEINSLMLGQRQKINKFMSKPVRTPGKKLNSIAELAKIICQN